MSAEKHQQLMDEGKLHPDGSMVVVCPTCLRPLAPGEQLPSAPPAEGDAVGQVETTVIDAATGEV